MDLKDQRKPRSGLPCPLYVAIRCWSEKNAWLKNIGSYYSTSVAKGLLSDLLLVDGDRCHDLPLLAHRTGIFAWPPLACILRMCHEVSVQVQPSGLPFQFSQSLGARIALAGKASVPQMPTRLLPGALSFAHLSLHALLAR